MHEPSIPQFPRVGSPDSFLSGISSITDDRFSDTVRTGEQSRLVGNTSRKPVPRRSTSSVSITLNDFESQHSPMSDATPIARVTSSSGVQTISVDSEASGLTGACDNQDATLDSGDAIVAGLSHQNSPVDAAMIPLHISDVRWKRGEAAVSEQPVQPHPKMSEDRLGVEGSQDAEQTLAKLWDPFWLRKSSLLAYAILYFFLAGALLALFFTSTRLEGLAASRSTMRAAYFWKFLPTAILVVTLSLWSPVDHFVRLLQPWRNLSTGPAPANRTLLLDHISRFQPAILISSIKHLEWPVILTTTVTIALTAIKVLSTGLLVIRPTSVSVSDIVMIRSAVFDPNLLNSSQDDSQYLALYSAIRKENMAQPPWTGQDFVAEPFVLPVDTILPTNATYSATTNAFFPKLSCERADLVGQPACPEWGCNISMNMTFSSGLCEMQVEHRVADSGLRQNVWAAENYVANVHGVSCYNETAFLVVVTQTDVELKLKNHRFFSALLCRPSYATKEVAVYVDSTGRQLYSTPRYGDIIQQPFSDANKIFSYIVNGSSGAPWFRPTGNVTERDYPFFTLTAIPIMGSDPGGSYLKPFLDTAILNSSLSDTFSGAFAILVSERMLRRHNSSIKGSLEYSKDRLHVAKTPAIAICSLLLSCVTLVTILILLHTSSIVPANPNCIVGIATILGEIREKHLFKQSCFRTTRRGLKNHDFSSTVPASSRTGPVEVGHKFDIIVHPNIQPKPLQLGTELSRLREKTYWWSPFTLKSWVKTSAVALCSALIIALEVLQRNSDRSMGLMDMSTSDTDRFWMSTIPALVMTGVVLLYSSMHFNTVLLSPYHALAYEKGASTKQSISTDYLGSTPLFAIFPAIHGRHYSAALSAVAAVVGAFLTVVVSGLYTIQTAEVTSSIAPRLLDGWNTTWEATYCNECVGTINGLNTIADGDGSAAYVLQYTVWRNLSDSIWTYDDLTFPSISVPYPVSRTDKGETITVTLPARRAVLECAVNGPSENEAVVHNETWAGNTYSVIRTKIFTKVTDTCLEQPSRELPLAVDGIRPITSYGGDVHQLAFSYEDFLRENVTVTADPSDKDLYFSGNTTDRRDCPSLFFYFGSFPDTIIRSSLKNSSEPGKSAVVSNFTSSEAQVSTLACRQKLQELDAIVTLRLPDLTIDKAIPPRTDENSVRYIGDTWQWPVQPFLKDLGILPVNKTFAAQAANLGPFFAAIVHGKDGIPASELVGEANIPRLESAVSKMYSRYMAQVMSRKMRLALSSTDQPRLVQATLLERKPRLFQQSAPKIILQVLLGLMMLCGVASWVLMPNVRLLPHDPCSIAGTACLLAGEEFWDDGKKEWEEDQLFRLETRGGRFGIYAVGAESRRLVE